MKRGGPLTRKTRLEARTQLTRTGGLNTQRAPLTRKPMTRARAPKPTVRTRKDTGPARDVRELVKERDAGLCVRCGAPAGSVHHRRPRGQGGTHGAESDRINQPSWLLCLCGSGVTGCHGWVESNRAKARVLGYLIPHNGAPLDAEAVPVRTLAGWRRFPNDGSPSVSCDPPSDAPPESAP